eukprot:3418104-Alexandrium_andersonii.AAC.1
MPSRLLKKLEEARRCAAGGSGCGAGAGGCCGCGVAARTGRRLAMGGLLSGKLPASSSKLSNSPRIAGSSCGSAAHASITSAPSAAPAPSPPPPRLPLPPPLARPPPLSPSRSGSGSASESAESE